MPDPLSPKEKRRLNKFINNVKALSRQKHLSSVSKFIKKQQLKAVLRILGEEQPSKLLRADALDIILDGWPFKNRRLRNLINGRRL